MTPHDTKCYSIQLNIFKNKCTTFSYLITKVSVNTTIIKQQYVYSSTATCFDSYESSSG